MPCSSDRLYGECGTTCAPSCRNVNNIKCTSLIPCVEGCHCPAGKMLDGNKCVAKSACSCSDNGIIYPNRGVRAEACQEW